MALKFYNTLSRTKEEFRPIKEGEISIYTCGPTIYNYVHIGNLKTFLFEDVLVRYLRYKGYNVNHIMNLTDVDDKTIRNSKKENLSLKDYTDKYRKAFFEDLETLNIAPATKYPAATEHIDDMVELVDTLIKKDYAYEADGSIYFRIDKFNDYGKLANLDKKKLRSGASGRVLDDEYEKESISDFVLWKAYSEDDGDVYWETKVGKGRPGWHLECSAMSKKYLGDTFDIHCGAVDLIFPHHTNEIAQSEAATGKKFVNYWIHGEFLNMGDEKMSKKLGNIVYLRDLLEKGYKPDAIRYYLISSHYRMPMTFKMEGLTSAENTLKRLNDFIHRCKNVSEAKESSSKVDEILQKTKSDFENAMDDDLNVSGALGSLFEMIKNINIEFENVGRKNADDIVGFLKEIDKVLGVMKFEEELLDDEIQKLIDERMQCRKDKDFKRADEIRDILTEQGIALEDTKDGTVWKRI